MPSSLIGVWINLIDGYFLRRCSHLLSRHSNWHGWGPAWQEGVQSASQGFALVIDHDSLTLFSSLWLEKSSVRSATALVDPEIAPVSAAAGCIRRCMISLARRI